jgi:hypothetical protein
MSASERAVRQRLVNFTSQRYGDMMFTAARNRLGCGCLGQPGVHFAPASADRRGQQSDHPVDLAALHRMNATTSLLSPEELNHDRS